MKKIMAITLLLGAQSAFGMDIGRAEQKRAEQALIACCAEGQAADVKLLLKKGGVNLNATNHQRMTPLLAATISWISSEEKVELLLNAKADPNVPWQNPGYTPLILAANRAHVTSVKRLLAAGANRDAKDDYGLTALYYSYPKSYENHPQKRELVALLQPPQ